MNKEKLLKTFISDHKCIRLCNIYKCGAAVIKQPQHANETVHSPTNKAFITIALQCKMKCYGEVSIFCYNFATTGQTNRKK